MSATPAIPPMGLNKGDRVRVVNPDSVWDGRSGRITGYSTTVPGAVWVDVEPSPGFALAVPQQFLSGELEPIAEVSHV